MRGTRSDLRRGFGDTGPGRGSLRRVCDDEELLFLFTISVDTGVEEERKELSGSWNVWELLISGRSLLELKPFNPMIRLNVVIFDETLKGIWVGFTNRTSKCAVSIHKDKGKDPVYDPTWSRSESVSLILGTLLKYTILS